MTIKVILNSSKSEGPDGTCVVQLFRLCTRNSFHFVLGEWINTYPAKSSKCIYLIETFEHKCQHTLKKNKTQQIKTLCCFKE